VTSLGKLSFFCTLLLFIVSCDSTSRPSESERAKRAVDIEFHGISGKLTDEVVRQFAKWHLEGRRENEVFPYLKKKLAIKNQEGAFWVLIESYYASGEQHAILLLSRKPESSTVELSTNYLPPKLNAEGEDEHKGDVDFGFVYEYDLKSEKKIHDFLKKFEKIPPHSGAWGDGGGADESSWFLSDSVGTRTYLYGYTILFDPEFPSELLSKPSKESRARLGYDYFKKVYELFGKLRESPMKEARKIELRQ